MRSRRAKRWRAEAGPISVAVAGAQRLLELTVAQHSPHGDGELRASVRCDDGGGGEAGDPAAPAMSVEQAAPAMSVDPAAPAKSVDPAAPAKGVDPAAPAKGVDPAAPAKGVEQAAPAMSVDPAAPAKGVQKRPL